MAVKRRMGAQNSASRDAMFDAVERILHNEGYAALSARRVAEESGARELQLNVVEQNEAGHRFWSRCGFLEVRRWRQWLDARESGFIRMRRSLKANPKISEESHTS